MGIVKDASHYRMPLPLNSFQRTLILLFVVAVLAFVGLTAATLSHVREGLQHDRLASENNQRLHLLHEVVGYLFQAESNQRAHAATGDPLFLREHEVNRGSLARSLGELKSMPVEGESAELLPRLADLIDLRTASMEALVNARREQGLDAAVAIIGSHEGKQLMDQVRDVSGRLVQVERQRLDERTIRSEHNVARLLWLLGALTGLLLLLLIAAYLVTRSELRRSARLAKELRITTREVSLINQLTSGLQSCGTREDTQEVLQHYLSRIFGHARGGLYLMRASRNLLEHAVSWGQEEPEGHSMQPQDCWALRMGGIHLLRPGSQDLACRHYSENGSIHLCMPLSAQSDIIGILHLSGIEPDTLTETRQLAERLAPHISTAMSGILLREALRQQNVRDPLTNLYNRRYLEETMAREVVRATRSGAPFSLVMIDIDHFKRFNDDHGHQAGDIMLKAFAEHLTRYVRGDDIVCRYGGEEFILVLPGATTEQACERADAVRAQLASLHASQRGEALPTITASMGVASYPTHGAEWESVLHLADAALYHAKHNGRNQVASADDVLRAAS